MVEAIQESFNKNLSKLVSYSHKLYPTLLASALMHAAQGTKLSDPSSLLLRDLQEIDLLGQIEIDITNIIGGVNGTGK